MCEDALNKDVEVLFILEDDAGFCEGFDSKLNAALKQLPVDWDGLWLGGSKVNVKPYSELLWRLHVGTGGYCVMMREPMIKQAIEYLKEENTIADLCYMKCMNQFKVFRTKENIVIHKPGFSLLKKQHVDYPELR